VPVDDVLGDREEVAQQGVVARPALSGAKGRLVVGADGLKVPERGIDGVALRSLSLVGEAVREHNATDIVRNSN
jgi:hypothetical protein